MVSHHVEERLAQRVVPAAAEFAFELLRDSPALATRVAAYFKQQEQPVPGRVALPLAQGEQPPLLVVTADGHGVTCLAAGMLFDGPVLPFPVVEAFQARQRDRLRTRMASQRLEALEAQGWNLDRTLDHAYRLTRSQYDRLVLLAPLLGRTVDRAMQTLGELFRLLSAQAGQGVAPMPEHLVEGFWRLSAECAYGLMVMSPEPGNNATWVRANTIPDVHVATRAYWGLINRPDRLLTMCRQVGHHLLPGLAKHWGLLLEFASLRFPSVRDQAREMMHRVPGMADWAPDFSAARRAEVQRYLEASAAQAVAETMGWCGQEPPDELFVRGAMAERLFKMADEPEPFLPRVAQLHPPWGRVLADLDITRDFSVFPPARPRPLESLSLEEHARVCLWRALLRDQRRAVIKLSPTYRWLLSLAPQEALVPDRDPDPAWALSAGKEYVRRCYPEFADLRKHKTIRRDPAAPQAGPNAPCPCGSGKKFKKCCGAP